MNTELISQVLRRSLPELAIGLSVCGAVLVMFVMPLEEKLGHERAAISSFERSMIDPVKRPAAGIPATNPPGAPSQGNAGTIQTHAAPDDPARAKLAVQQIADRSRPATDRTRMFDALMNLADTTGVRINQFQPSSTRPRAQTSTASASQGGSSNTSASMSTAGAQGAKGQVAGTASGAQPGAQPAPARPVFDARVAYSISLEGDYSSVVRFIRGLQGGVGFTSVRSIRVSPGSEGQRVNVALETEHVAFDVARFMQVQLSQAGGVTPKQGATTP